MNNQPIGIFDSGVGGLSVWKEIVKLLPDENIVYLSDSKNCPYGSKSENEIIELSVKNVDFLQKYECKLIVVACNTATAAAIRKLRSIYTIPFVGMEPAVKPAALNSKTKNIGILATEGTFKGNHFNETKKKYARGIKLHLQVGYKLVEHIEQGDFESVELQQKLESYIVPMIKNNVDKIVLGCTHYPFLRSKIETITGKNVEIIDPSPAVARRVYNVLKEFNLLNKAEKSNLYQFFSTGSTITLDKLIQTITKRDYSLHKVDPTLF